MSDLPKIGIDIGSASIKLVELSPTGKDKWKLTAAATMPSYQGGVVGNINNLAPFSAAVVKMLKESGARSRKVVAALPEEQISSHVVEMPLMKDEEVRQALQWQVEQYIPIPADKAVWSYQIIKKDTSGGGMEVLLVAVAKNLVSAYTQVLEQAGLEVLALETELMATSRAVVPDNYPLSMIVDIGAKSTDLGIIKNGLLVFSRTIPTAGEAFNRAISTTLGLDPSQAEQYKKTYGFSGNQLEGKLAEAMKPVLTVIANEIKKTSDFYVSKHPGETVKLITLSGGIALIPDLVGALSGLVGVEVAIANPFEKIIMDANQQKSLTGTGPFYVVSIGLAMRGI
jgi:type IV pilus assembly protein PilM